MSFSIPAQIEKDIIAGLAQYRTFQTGNGGQSILQVPTNSYAVIYGYDFSPAGGGFTNFYSQALANSSVLHANALRFFETQQISFYTGTDFYPFIHHVNVNIAASPEVYDNPVPPTNAIVRTYKIFTDIDNTPISRQVYITSNKDVTITHGLILNAFNNTSNAIPITNRTPLALTYGGSPEIMNTQTNYGGLVNPVQFMQPSTKDYVDFAFGLLPNNPDDQAFATPDATNGLLASTTHLQNIGGDTFNSAAACNYYLCLHYALYTAAIPEQRG